MLNGTGSGVASYTTGSTDLVTSYSGIVGDGATASTFSNDAIYIPNYSGSTNKSVSIDTVTENNATAAHQTITASVWANTAAITSIKIVTGANFAQYSTASLYKFTKGSGGATVS
jgi:hypothetical protein